MAIVSFLLIGWILGWFKFDELFIQAIKELFSKEITKASYYFVFFYIGALGDIVLKEFISSFHKNRDECFHMLTKLREVTIKYESGIQGQQDTQQPITFLQR
jgi:hypothetical protein